ncbi:MAG: hypothetical protein ACRYHA_02305 [Janthinobacterium lividum]
MKNLKLIVATCASIAALGAVPTVHAQDSTTSAAPSSRQSTPAPTRHSRHAATNDNGCTGPASFCSTYFGN